MPGVARHLPSSTFHSSFSGFDDLHHLDLVETDCCGSLPRVFAPRAAGLALRRKHGLVRGSFDRAGCSAHNNLFAHGVRERKFPKMEIRLLLAAGGTIAFAAFTFLAVDTPRTSGP